MPKQIFFWDTNVELHFIGVVLLCYDTKVVSLVVRSADPVCYISQVLRKCQLCFCICLKAI